MLEEKLGLAAAYPHVEARRSPTVVGWAETARGQHLVDAECTAIAHDDDAWLEAPVRAEARQHVHRFPVDAPHLSVFYPVIHT